MNDDGEGSIYISSSDFAIYRLSPGSTVMERFAGNPNFQSDRGRNGHRLKDAQFKDPAGIEPHDFSASGRIWVADIGALNIRLIKDDIVTTYAGNGGHDRKDGPISTCSLIPASIMYIRHANVLIISEYARSGIRIIDCTNETIRTLHFNDRFQPHFFPLSANLNALHPHDSFMPFFLDDLSPKYNRIDDSWVPFLETLGSSKSLPVDTRPLVLPPEHSPIYMVQDSMGTGEAWSINWRTGDREKLGLINPMAVFGRTFLLVERKEKERICSVTRVFHDGTIRESPRAICELTSYARIYSMATNTLLQQESTGFLIVPSFILPHPLLEQHTAGQIDFTPLLDSNLTSDLLITHNASGISWNLSKVVLSFCDAKINPETLQNVISESSLSVDSISLFIDFIYQKIIYFEYDTRPISQWIDLITLGTQIGIDCSQLYFIFRDALETVSGLSGVDQLVSLFNSTWGAKMPSISLLLALRIRRVTNLIRLNLSEILPQDSEIRVYFGNLPPETGLEIKLTPPSRIIPAEPQWVDLPSNTSPESLLASQDDFAFTLDEKRWIIAKGWMILPQWRWFENLIRSGLEESRSRVIRMPTDLTPKAMMAIIRATNTVNFRYIDDLETEDIRSILNCSVFFSLAEDDETPLGCFKPLLDRCAYEKSRWHDPVEPLDDKRLDGVD